MDVGDHVLARGDADRHRYTSDRHPDERVSVLHRFVLYANKNISDSPHSGDYFALA